MENKNNSTNRSFNNSNFFKQSDLNFNKREKNNFEKLFDRIEELSNLDVINKLAVIDKQVHLKNKEVLENVYSSISIRKNCNTIKEINHIEKYKRKNEEMINFQSAISENFFPFFLFHHYKKDLMYNNKKFEVIEPAAGSIFVNHSKEDFIIIDKLNKKELMFDIKAYYRFKDRITINQKTHNIAKIHNCKFYMICIIDSDINNYKEIKNLSFYVMPISFFEKNSKLIVCNKDSEKKFTPFYSLDIKYFK